MNKSRIACILISIFLLGVFILKEHFQNSSNDQELNIYIYNYLDHLVGSHTWDRGMPDQERDRRKREGYYLAIKRLHESILLELDEINIDYKKDVRNWKNLRFTIYPKHIRVTLMVDPKILEILKKAVPSMKLSFEDMRPILSDIDIEDDTNEVTEPEASLEPEESLEQEITITNISHSVDNMNNVNKITAEDAEDKVTQMTKVEKISSNSDNDWESELDGWNIVQSKTKPLSMSDINQSYIKGVASVFAPEITIGKI